MLATTFYSLHVEGGMIYMVPLSLLFAVNIGILVYILINLFQKKQLNKNGLQAIKQIGVLAAAWGTWSTILGLFQAFDAIEASPEVIPFPVICGGLKVALITVLYGLLIYCLSLVAYLALRLASRNTSL